MLGKRRVPPLLENLQHGFRFLYALSNPNSGLLGLPSDRDKYIADFRDQCTRQGTGPIVIEFPYQVEYREIQQVIDLRDPQAQNWFYEKFQVGDGKTFNKPNGTNIGSFLEMLPTLMASDRGGNDVTSAIGVWMRNNGVHALIFPSARMDAAVTIKDGKITDWLGWNLIDYRTATEKP